MKINSWSDECTTPDTNAFVRILARRHLSRVSNTPLREKYEALNESQNFAELCRAELDYTDISVDDARNLRQALGFYAKRSDLEIGVDRRQVARDSFRESESLCFETNDLFRKRNAGSLCFPQDVEGWLHDASRRIASILGDLPPIEELKIRFGPGATTTTKKSEASPRRKMGSTLACSGDFSSLAPALLESLPHFLPDSDQVSSYLSERENALGSLGTRSIDHPPEWFEIAYRETLIGGVESSFLGLFDEVEEVGLVSLEIHPGKLDFVPKNAKTDRGIVVEPVLNTLVQLGIGDYISSRLRLAGVDLRDQTKNQSLAVLGSQYGDLATLDLRMASDLVSDAVVAELLPLDWYLFLSQARTGFVEDDTGAVFKLQKFSSMGNGFTFALESLIFFALISAVRPGEQVSAYGDDLIVRCEDYDAVVKLLHHCGFVVNKSKSFSSGPFRESCGVDILSGINIRPFYLKGPFTGEALFSLHNHYVRQGDLEMAGMVLWAIPSSIRIFGPDGFGDGHLVGDHAKSPYNQDRGWNGYLFSTWKWQGRRDYASDLPDKHFALYQSYMRLPSDTDLVSCNDERAHYSKDGVLGIATPGKGEYAKITRIYTFLDD